ncbi:hypothetical protein KR018_000017 [Drosophila ironensis]|nr:hypothetical protein KR018_000017 [Drosophila ironensis]
MGLWNSKQKKSVQAVAKPQQNVKAKPIPEPDMSKLIPEWLNKSQFEELIAANVPQFSKIVDFRVRPAMAPGENYATLMLRISVDVELTDKSTKELSYMIKVPHQSSQMDNLLALANFFTTENSTYADILPKLEGLYKSKGMDITFAPKAFKLDSNKVPAAANTVLMNDLSQQGYKNINRLNCLDFEQAKFALKKLAQYHAASAMMVQVYGPFPDLFLYGMMGNNKELIKGFLEQMLGPFRTAFLANLHRFKNGEKFRSKLEAALAQLTSHFVDLGEIDYSEFNVLNHGDCWMNNLLFKHDSNGKLEDMVFVDFQNPKFGTPIMDLLYFIITSVHIDYKLDQFDFFIRHYHDELTKHLNFLGFTGYQPSLRELHGNVIKYSGFLLYPAVTVLPLVLLDSNDAATFDNFMGESEAGNNFKNLLYANKRYQEYIEKILPWMENRGFLDISVSSPTVTPQELQAPEAGKAAETSAKDPQQILDWLHVNDFTEIISSAETNFEKILSGSWQLATNPGDNYASKLLKIDIQVQLKDKTTKTFSYIVKINVTYEGADFSAFNLFPKEIEMYSTFVPAFEKLYKDSGVPVTFSAKSYRLKKDVSEEYLIMENLQSSGFKMCDRLKGLDMEHSKASLKKLAQWHAASLKYKELNGPYPQKYNETIFTEKTAGFFKSMFEMSNKQYLEAISKFDGADEYSDKMTSIVKLHIDKVLENAKINEDEFNVLNHGDAWINNIMFQYDSEGQLKDTFLLDHQVTKYGNPAQDLYYFIISSTQLDIKVDQFDYLIKWYHENLVEHTTLLKYSGYVPNLKELHIILLKHPVYACGTVVSTLTICLNKTDENFSAEHFMRNDEVAEATRNALYNNERYKANVEKILPWLNKRGLLDAFIQYKAQ